MIIKDLINKRLSDFIYLCKTHKVKYIYAFGSSVTDKFDYEKSDIDLIVEINDTDPIDKGEKLISLWDKLENFFQRKVDLLTDKPIENSYLRNSIESTKILIYDGKSQEILI